MDYIDGIYGHDHFILLFHKGYRCQILVGHVVSIYFYLKYIA